MRFFRYILILFCVSLLAMCSSKKKALPTGTAEVEVPYQEFEASILYLYTGEVTQWKLESKYMRKPLADTGSIMVTPVRLTLYDSIGQVRTRVLSDSGTTDSKMESFIVWGDVLISTSDSMVVRTQKLWWNKKRHKVESDTYVQIETSKGDVLRGKGLDATEDFSRFSFKANVSGKFPNFKRRMENNEESVF